MRSKKIQNCRYCTILSRPANLAVPRETRFVNPPTPQIRKICTRASEAGRPEFVLYPSLPRQLEFSGILPIRYLYVPLEDLPCRPTLMVHSRSPSIKECELLYLCPQFRRSRQTSSRFYNLGSFPVSSRSFFPMSFYPLSH